MHDNFAELHTLCQSIIEYDINVISFQEVNLNLLQHNIREQIKRVFQTYFPYFKLIYSTSPIKAPTAWKPDSTMMVIIGKFSHAVTRTSSDLLGRWCRATIQLKRGRQLTIYSVYNITKTDISRAGPSTI